MSSIVRPISRIRRRVMERTSNRDGVQDGLGAQSHSPIPEDWGRLSDSGNLLERLEQLNHVGIALSEETDITRLLETILVVAKWITNADGGTLYLVTDEHSLKFEIVRTDSLGLAMGGTTGIKIPFEPVRLYDDAGKPILSNVVAYAYHRDTSLNITDAYTERGFDFSCNM